MRTNADRPRAIEPGGTVDVSTLSPIQPFLLTAADVVSSLDTEWERWYAGSIDHAAHYAAMVNIWAVAEAAGVAADAKRIICTR